MTIAIDPTALLAARSALERALSHLVQVVDLLPGLEGETRMATAELDAALSDVRVARGALDVLESPVDGDTIA